MPDEPRVQQLLEELLESHATPEEVCGSCVELLPVVRARWRQLNRARAELDAMFPPEAEPGAPPPGFAPGDAPLPLIPGYEVEGVLGLGGMGIVFRARHLRLNRVVALKMALAGAYAGAPERERFQREAEAVAALHHPNVVQVHDVGDVGSLPYFTMEYVGGGSLAEKLAGTPLPAREAATLLVALAGAVAAAHQAGIIHRDLKPANVLLTPDGVPKISDFGLARRLGGAAGLTRTGTAVGTPSYMAPEQARGKADAAGPPVDIYALGTILYELLTGRPPFRAESAAETVHQLLTRDPISPSRLNGKVPRDLETICLKCLHKELRLRYASASALADDLERFLRGEAIAARPEGPLARFARRVRRRPRTWAAAVAGTLVAIVLCGSGLRMLSDQRAARRAAEQDQAETERAVDERLRETARALRAASEGEARAALKLARERLGTRDPADLRRRFEPFDREIELMHRLEEIRLSTLRFRNGTFEIRDAGSRYEQLFRGEGLLPYPDAPDAVAERILASNIRSTFVAALDDWAACARDPGRRKWALELAALADPAPSDWRTRARNPATWEDKAALAGLLASAPVNQSSVKLLLAIERYLHPTTAAPFNLLRRIQTAMPGDYEANRSLAFALSGREHPTEEAIGYFRAALACRPEVASPYNDLGLALHLAGRRQEAVEIYRAALLIEPDAYYIHYDIAYSLTGSGRHQEAIDHAQLCIRRITDAPADDLDPGNLPWLHILIGYNLNALGRYDESIDHHRRAVALAPKLSTAQSSMRNMLMGRGRMAEAQIAWKEALAIDPPDHADWYGYAELCLFLGQEEEYGRARQALLAKFSTDTEPAIAERTSRACLLLPWGGEELNRAAALAERAAAVDRAKVGGTYPYYLFARGLAEYRLGHFGRAISIIREALPGVPNPSPRLVLAMALHKSGQAAEARKTLAAAVLNHDWRANQVKDQDGWIYHSLRREAEGMILPNLPAFLEGKHQPQDNEERLALLGVCRFTNRSLALARLYTDAFAADPRFAADFRSGHRYNAACAAARTGSGIGADVAELGEPERAEWRTRARGWIRADLASWGKSLDGAPPADRGGVRQRLTQWRSEPELAGLRDAADLAELPEDERKECIALWAAVDAVLDRCGDGK